MPNYKQERAQKMMKRNYPMLEVVDENTVKIEGVVQLK